MKKKIISLCLVLVMLLSLIPTVYADEPVSDLLAPSTASVRVYIRAFDISQESKGGMVANANYMGEKYRAAFPGADVRVSTGGKTKDEVFAEMDALFAGSTDATRNYVVLCGHGSSTGYHFILDKHSNIQLPKVVEHLDGFGGKFFILLSGCYIGQWIDGETHPEFIEELDKHGSKYTILSDASDSNLYRPFSTGAAADITGKWADGLTQTYDAQGFPHITADLNDDGILTAYEQLCYCTSGSYSYEALIYPENDASSFMKLPFRAVFRTGNGGDFADGSDELVVPGSGFSVNEPETPVPADESIVFDGWFSSPEGGEKVSFPLTLTHHRTLYAQWSRNGEKINFSDAGTGDIVRIKYKDGTFCDYYILDAEQTNDGEPGMFLFAKTIQGNTTFANGLSSIAWASSQAKGWCQAYIDNKFDETLVQLLLPSYAGTIYSSETLNGDKIFFLSRDEVEKYTSSEQSSSLGRWWIRANNNIFGLYYEGDTIGSYFSPKMANSLGARPALNLNIGTADLEYVPETGYYTLRAQKNITVEPFKPIDLSYYVKVNGEISYTATGDRDNACDQMNTMAETPWILEEPTAYNVFGGGKTTLVAGSYKGIPYSQYTRDFSSVDNLTDEFAQNGIRGLDCSSATCYAIRKATDSDILRLEDSDTVYRTRNLVGDALNVGEGTIRAVSKNGWIPFLDYLTIVGDYGSYRYGDEINTKLIIENILEQANYTEGTIYDHVYAKMKPGDILVRHYYKGEGFSDLSSHTQLVTGVELVYTDGKLDPDQSRVYFTDTSSPNRTTFRSGGEKTAWANGNTVTKNYLTFTQCTDSACLIPITMNEWKEPADVIASGADSVWMRNSGVGIEFTVNVPSSEFTLVRIDGKSVEYTVVGSVVHIGEDVLEALSDGYHTVAILSKNGEAVTHISVVPCDHSMAYRIGNRTVTCLEDGFSGDLYCPNCKKTVETGKVIPATGHTPRYEGGVPATHTSEGSTGDAYCSVCGIFLEGSKVIPMLKYQIILSDAVWQKGSTTQLSVKVDMPKKDISSFKLDKSYPGYTYSGSSSSTTIWLKTATLESLALGTHTITITAKDGCSVSCTFEVVKACEHENTSVINAVAATCLEEGYSGDIYCNDCKRVISEGLNTAKTDHSPALVNAKPASCTGEGYTGDTVCEVCRQSIEKGSSIPALGHSFSLGKCQICGEPDPDYNPGGGVTKVSFFQKIINFIKSLFSWLPFC